VDFGGVLTGKKVDRTNEFFNLEMHNTVQDIFSSYSGYLTSFSKQRSANYQQIVNALGDVKEIYHFQKGNDPFVFGFYSDQYKSIYQALDTPNGVIQMGRTHVAEHVLLPVNPFLNSTQIDQMLNLVVDSMKS